MPTVQHTPEFRKSQQLYFKNEGKLREWDQRMQFALDRVLAIFFRNQLSMIVTSIWRDPAKSATFSLHGWGFAFDVDTTHDLTLPFWGMLKTQVEFEIGTEFQVITHDVGSGLHMHVEYDPQDDPYWKAYKDGLQRLWSTLRQEEAGDVDQLGK